MILEPKISCNATCPPDYAIIYIGSLQDEVEIIEPSVYSYKAAKKHSMGSKSTKGRKTVKRPEAKKANIVATCPPYECVPMPTIPPTECPKPSCPLNFQVKFGLHVELFNSCCVF